MWKEVGQINYYGLKPLVMFLTSRVDNTGNLFVYSGEPGDGPQKVSRVFATKMALEKIVLCLRPPTENEARNHASNQWWMKHKVEESATLLAESWQGQNPIFLGCFERTSGKNTKAHIVAFINMSGDVYLCGATQYMENDNGSWFTTHIDVETYIGSRKVMSTVEDGRKVNTIKQVTYKLGKPSFMAEV